MRRSPAPDDAPFVVVCNVRSALRIAALNDAAARRGLKRGMALADARAMYPALQVAQADAQADCALLETVAGWCERYTPLVGLHPPDGLVLDITGCVHLFGGEAGLCRDLVARLTRQRLRARVAVAGSVGCAFALARYGAHDVAIVPQGGMRAALLPLPVAALRLGDGAAEALAKMGLHTVADVIARPRAPLAARFGEELIRRIDQALGREEESIVPRLPAPAAIVERSFPDPIAREVDVLGTIEQLAHRLGHLLERRGEGARLLQVLLFRADGRLVRLETGAAAPVRDSAHIRRLFENRLAAAGDEADPGFGFDMVRLAALITERCDPLQTGLQEPGHARAREQLIDRLAARFGARRLVRLMPRNTHCPERAAIAIPAQVAALEPVLAHRPLQQDSLMPLRPLRLFERPEPIETLAEVPDGPPGRFRWRHLWHEVTRAEGPERIAPEWWWEGGGLLTRDYFRVECENGARAWIFREGLYERETTQPRWFLHGLFA